MCVERQGDLGNITITQQRYIENTLQRFEMSDCKPISTPLETNINTAAIESVKAATHGPVCLSGRPAQAGLCKSAGPCGCTTRPVCLSGRPVQARLTPHSGRDRDS